MKICCCCYALPEVPSADCHDGSGFVGSAFVDDAAVWHVGAVFELIVSDCVEASE
jgi:hypothetical protein